MRDRRAERRIEEYWSWLAAALFLLVTVDMVTTVFAARVHGVGAEANPLVRAALRRGPTALAVVNLVAVVLVAGLFYGLVELLRAMRPRYRRPFAVLLEVFMGLLLTAGLAIFANNLAVILLGSSLL
ncbi:hypothetical protein [Halosegnis sp.]|uniref:hypothetical protein n=1 Tax=Halosegnis sp. TaxID=2864959 RepID=UPI0035D4456E